MNKTLFAKELRANLFVSGIIAAVLAMYIGTIVAMYDPKLGESLDLMMSMPELFAAFGMSMRATTLLRVHAQLFVRVPADHLHPRVDPS